MNATLQSVVAESETVITFYFRPERPLDAIAGQFVELTIPHHGPDKLGIRRQFTLSSSPTEKYTAITVNFAKRTSSFKHALHALQPGDMVHMSDPLGDFVLPLDSSVPLVWIAGGIGITPFRSMASWLTDQNESREILLFHSIRNRDESIFGDVIKSAGIKEHDLVETASQARLTANEILAAVSDPVTPLFYISGPEAMVETLSHGLRQHNIPREHIIVDVFLGY
jgi:glycine betaine catabolism B